MCYFSMYQLFFSDENSSHASILCDELFEVSLELIIFIFLAVNVLLTGPLNIY